MKKPCPLLILPNSHFKIAWNLIIVILLIYTATFVPYRVAFLGNDTDLIATLDILTDALFGIDIAVNFLSAYEKNDRSIEMNPIRIFLNYIKGWFFLDFLAVFPFSSLNLSGSS